MGHIGSISKARVSDAVIPYLRGTLLGIKIALLCRSHQKMNYLFFKINVVFSLYLIYQFFVWLLWRKQYYTSLKTSL